VLWVPGCGGRGTRRGRRASARAGTSCSRTRLPCPAVRAATGASPAPVQRLPRRPQGRKEMSGPAGRTLSEVRSSGRHRARSAAYGRTSPWPAAQQWHEPRHATQAEAEDGQPRCRRRWPRRAAAAAAAPPPSCRQLCVDSRLFQNVLYANGASSWSEDPSLVIVRFAGTLAKVQKAQ